MYYIDIDHPKDLKVCLVKLHYLTQTKTEEWNSIESLNMKMPSVLFLFNAQVPSEHDERQDRGESSHKEELRSML